MHARIRRGACCIRRRQAVARAGVDDDDLDARRDRDRSRRQVACVDEQRRADLAELATSGSMMPTCAPTNSFSERCTSNASARSSSASVKRCRSARSSATPSAALDDSPPPIGTLEWIVASKPVIEAVRRPARP
jgi:hypothetical protein